MSSSAGITFLTAPRPHLPGTTASPYEEVLKLVTSDGIERNSPTIADYELTDLNETEFEFTDELSGRLIDFFDRYLAGRHDTGVYNCHRFAMAMSGIAIPEGYEGSDLRPLADTIVAKGKLQGYPLDLGRMGTIGHKARGVPSAAHSVIGLGKDSRQCLQVMSIAGPLALDTYTNTLRSYLAPDPGRPPDGYGLYGLSYIRRLSQRILR